MPTLFDPIRFGSIESANRIAMAPVNTATRYGADAVGYTDYPALGPATAEA
jgi:2,4-dienoyl-CoA reductase-like NADH-dependent reductase (Old Yellow Enzyme family)